MSSTNNNLPKVLGAPQSTYLWEVRISFVIPRTPVLDASSKSCTSHQHYYVQKENYMNIFTDKIDKLEAKQVKLESSKEEKTSKINAKNNRIGARVKRLEEKMYMNRLALDKFLAKTDLELERNAKMITAEAQYAGALGAKYKSIVNKPKNRDSKDSKDIKSKLNK